MSAIRDAMFEVRDALDNAGRRPRHYGGHRQRVLTDNERAAAIENEQRLLELARRSLRKAA